MALDFIYTQPVKIIFGEGKFAQLGEVLQELGVQRCVIACGRHFAPTAKEMQEADSRIVGVFGGVEQNPQLSGVKETARIAREAGAGTGSEVTQVSVVSNGTEKKTINNPVFMPKAAIVDPVLSSTVPPRTTMNTGLDAMAHALEGYWSKNHQPISDLMAIESVRLVLENLETAFQDGSNMEARANMAFASLLGGLSFALPKTAGSHACSYPLSEDYHLPHGEAVAFTLDSFVRINSDARLELLCKRIGLSGTGELADRIAALKELGGLRRRLSDLGDVDLDKLAHDCAVHGLMQNNPVAMDEAALRAMFEKLQ